MHQKYKLIPFVCLMYSFSTGTIHSVYEEMEAALTHSQRTNFRLFQTERVCRFQISNLIKMAESYQNG